ncbi:MAG: hypothetical protein WA130_01375 [Candidatus Methanoperedens sp.]
MQTLKEDSAWSFINEFVDKMGNKHIEIECINCGIREREAWHYKAHSTIKKLNYAYAYGL